MLDRLEVTGDCISAGSSGGAMGSVANPDRKGIEMRDRQSVF
ncbi:hypothetical protein Z947_1499 [Sulfitobacter geojensis]|nr:hypothetical protein Z947_1499 [Sulfitobacter geojensis]